MAESFIENAKEKLFYIDSRKLYIIGFVIRLILLGFFGESWDIYVFITATKQFLLQGVSPYEVALEKPPYIYMPFYPYIENWYAYPPLMLFIFSAFYALYLILPVDGPFFERFFIKLPVAAGDLLLSWSIGKLVFYLTGDKRKARHAELSILFNPFFILISSVWGMFDSFSFAFLIISVLFILEGHDYKGAATYAISVLIKQTTLFASPILFFFWLKYRGFKKTLLYVSLSVSVFLLVSLPFLITTPSGYLQQVLMLHVNRPPWGYNIFTAAYFLLVYLESGLVIGNRIFGLFFLAFVSALSLSLIATTILFLGYSYYRKENAEPRDIIYYLMLVYFTFIFLNKVTNEPYFIYLMGLMIVYGLHRNDTFIFREFSSLSYYLLLSTLIAAMRFIIFIPYDVLVQFIGVELSNSVFQLTPIYGEANPYVVATLAIGAIIIVPTYLNLFKYYLEKARRELSISIIPNNWLKVLKSRALRINLKKIGSYKSILVIFFLLIFAYQMSSLSTLIVYNGNGETYAQPSQLVAIHYVWMDNPSHNPDLKTGSWEDSFLTPIEGFYESKTPYIKEDLQEIKSASINAILVEVYLGRSAAVTNIADIAYSENLTVIPYIDLGRMINITYFNYIQPDIGNGTKIKGFYSIKLDSWTTFLSTVLDISDVLNMPNVYKIGKAPVLIIDGAQYVYPSFDSEAIDYQISNLYEYFDIENRNTTALLDYLSERWNTTLVSISDLYGIYPRNISQFLNTSDLIHRDLLNLYLYSFEKFWNSMIKTIKDRESDIYVVFGYGNDPLGLLNISIFNKIGNGTMVSRYYGHDLLSSLRINQFYALQQKILNYRKNIVDIKQTYFIVLNTTTNILPLYSLYNYTWGDVISAPGNITLIFSWNDYKLGSVIEPTHELGYKPLELTKKFVNKLGESLINSALKIEEDKEVMIIEFRKK